MKIVLRPFVWRDPTTLPKRRFIYGSHYIRGFTSSTASNGGVGKSSLKLVELVAIATGRPLLGIEPLESVPCWYWNGEDPTEETERRIHAILQNFLIKPSELENRLFIGSGRVDPIKLAALTKGGVQIDDELAASIETQIKENGIGVSTLDPLIRTHAVAENSNEQVDPVMAAFAKIAEATDSSIELVHHVKKPAPGQTESRVEDGRGASAINNSVRSAQVLNKLAEGQGEAVGIEAKDCWRYFRVDNGKANLAPPSQARWYQLRSVELPNGDLVGVVDRWTFPSALDAIKTGDVEIIRDMVRSGDYRADPQAKDWIGYAVAEKLAMSCETKAEKSTVKRILAAWFKSGALTTEKRKDSSRREREFVIPGNYRQAEAA